MSHDHDDDQSGCDVDDHRLKLETLTAFILQAAAPELAHCLQVVEAAPSVSEPEVDRYRGRLAAAGDALATAGMYGDPGAATPLDRLVQIRTYLDGVQPDEHGRVGAGVLLDIGAMLGLSGSSATPATADRKRGRRRWWRRLGRS